MPSSEAAISQDHRALSWVECGILFLLILYMCGHILPRAWRSLITDFPNYYMSARLVHESYGTSRMYEWDWLQREKDHRAVDVRVIGLIPITPFSTLFVWPLSGLAPLAAKHAWILLNLASLIPIAWLLHSMIGLRYRRIALAFALSAPLYRNLEFGQFYVLLLLLLVAACWAYLRKYHVWAGALIAIAAACKIFPVIFFIFFLRRKSWRALASGVATGLAAVAMSVAVFGWNVHRTYLKEVLPWALHGGGFEPYQVSASIASVLHYLFLSEPQWNPHPWHYSPLSYALLSPALQMIAMAPALLLISRRDNTRNRILLEWSALLTASLTISTLAASYNFMLMVLPVCALAALFLEHKRYGWLIALLIAYLSIGIPMLNPRGSTGPAILLYVPRLPLMFALLLGIYVLLLRDGSIRDTLRDWSFYAWAIAIAAFAILSACSIFHFERAVRQEYAYRLPMQGQGFLNACPRASGNGVRYVAFTSGGYRLVTEGPDAIQIDPPCHSPDDDLSFASRFETGQPEQILVERVSGPHSQIVDPRNPTYVVVDDAREPMLSIDGRLLAFIRDDHGRGHLFVTMISGHPDVSNGSALTPPALNVYEASFLSDREYAFSAVENGHPPQIFLRDASHQNAPLALGEARYPSLSPNGKSMAYSHLDHGFWNLWLRDQQTGKTKRVADVPCNQIQPAWEDDSKTLLYATDCGRSLWFTAVARRKVVP